MPHMNTLRSKPVTAVLLLVLASVVLAACGGSSSTSTTTTNASATTPTTTTTTTTPTTGGAGGAAVPGGPNAGRFAAVRECLRKNGIVLPKHTPGQRPVLPAGTTRAQYEVLIKKCGGGVFSGGAARFRSPQFKAELAKFAACMKENGVNVPAPNTSGKGPIFNSAGIDTRSATFRAAESKCSAALRSSFRRPSPAGGAGQATG